MRLGTKKGEREVSSDAHPAHVRTKKRRGFGKKCCFTCSNMLWFSSASVWFCAAFAHGNVGGRNHKSDEKLSRHTLGLPSVGRINCPSTLGLVLSLAQFHSPSTPPAQSVCLNQGRGCKRDRSRGARASSSSGHEPSNGILSKFQRGTCLFFPEAPREATSRDLGAQSWLFSMTCSAPHCSSRAR